MAATIVRRKVQPCNYCSNEIEPVRIAEKLPENYVHYICHYEEKDDSAAFQSKSSNTYRVERTYPKSGSKEMYKEEKENSAAFKATLTLPIKTEEGAKEWLKAFQSKSLNTYRVERTYPKSGSKVMYKVEFCCQHCTHPRSSSADKRRGSKNTNCPATLSIVIKKSEFSTNGGKKRKCRSSDPHMPHLPMTVTMNYSHNHPIEAADALRHRDVPDDVKEKFLEMFKNGYSPSKALDLHKYDLQVEYGDDYVFKCGDRATCPDLQFCYRLYYSIFKKEYGEPHGEQVLKLLERKIDDYNDRIAQNSVRTKVIQETQAAIAIITPLMRRVHKFIKHSGELMFIDATGNMDRQGCRVFLLLTHSAAGGLPLGVLITTSESTQNITQALTLYNELLDDSCYYGRGYKTGPEIIMTDDSTSQRQALHSVYPKSVLLLCIFHLLQAFWRFVWESKNGVRREDRSVLLSLLKAMVYCNTVELLETKYQALLRDATVAKYENVRKHVETIYARRESWALCYRSELHTRGNNTNNYSEAAMRIMKDRILDRTKAYNVLQLVDFITTRMESYFERRLLDICNNRLERALQSRYLPSISDGSGINAEQIVLSGESVYHVPSEKEADITYIVDMSVGICSCKVGKTGGPCKHQYKVLKKFNLSSWNFIPVSDETMRTLFYTVATGSTTIPTEWFRPLHETPKDDQVDDQVDVKVDCSSITNDLRCSSATDQFELTYNPASLESPQEHSQSVRSCAVNNADPVINDLDQIFKSIKEKYENNENLGSALQAFIKHYRTLTTDSALASALHCFGKYTGVASTLGEKS